MSSISGVVVDVCMYKMFMINGWWPFVIFFIWATNHIIFFFDLLRVKLLSKSFILFAGKGSTKIIRILGIIIYLVNQVKGIRFFENIYRIMLQKIEISNNKPLSTQRQWRDSRKALITSFIRLLNIILETHHHLFYCSFM